MTALMLREFTHFHTLKACGVAMLQEFFGKFTTSIGKVPGLVMPVLGSGPNADNEYIRAVLAVFKQPERLPGDMCEILYQVDALARAETADKLTALAFGCGIPLKKVEDPTEAEMALQIWLANPGAFKAAYETQKLQALRTFTHFLSEEHGPKEFAGATMEQKGQLADEVRPWFKKYGRGGDVWVDCTELKGEWWFVLDHGERMQRTGEIKDGERTVRNYRPDTDDVLVYCPETNTIRICAGTTSVVRQFRDAFGKVFFGAPDYFCKEEVYRFEPVVQDPDTALDVEGLAGIDEIRLVDIRYRAGGKFNEFVTRRASDVVAMYESWDRPLPEGKKVHRLGFEVTFSGDKKPRPVKITSRSSISIARNCDHRVIHAWLRLREIEVGSGEEAADAAS